MRRCRSLPRWPTPEDVAAFTTTDAGVEEVSPPGLLNTSPPTASTELAATRRRPSSRPRATRRRTPAPAQGSRARRFGYADPPYPGRAENYPEREEVDHAQLIARLVAEFPDGWGLSTSAEALQYVLALCPPDVRVCSWHRPIRRTPSRRPLSAWEPLIVHRGRELPTDRPQTATDALEYRGRFRGYPGAIVGIEAAAVRGLGLPAARRPDRR
jgi:hypothetical protein